MRVEIQLCNDCKTETVFFHAGTLRSYLEKEPYAEHKLRKLKASQWVSFCPECHAGVLKPEGKNFDLPVFCSDGVFRTSTDLLKNQAGEPEAIWDFWGLRFTPAALINASELLQFTYPGTERVEQLGKELRTGASDDSIGFSKEVCRWGGGLRVWGGLERHHEEAELSKKIKDWLCSATTAESAEAAIEQGTAIKGLGVSFASKHLRMFDPEKFCVLDDVLSKGLGIALNPKGYQLFLSLLQAFNDEKGLKWPMAKLESALFMLVRQQVRS